MSHHAVRSPSSFPLPRLLPVAAAVAVLCCHAGGAWAQASSSPPAADPNGPKRLDAVVVKGQSMPGAASPYSATTLDAEQIRDAAVSQPEELLRRVPGVEVRGYHLGGVVNVITIRGFNGGAHGGDLGMAIDGIPLNEAMSHADGYADLNVVVPLEIESFRVYRGPVSALYGNFNRGGVIAVESRRGGEYALGDVSAGSFSTVDAQAALGRKLGPGQFNGALQLNRTGDYRPDSHFGRGTLAGRYTLDLTPRAQLSLSGRAHRGDWASASYLTKAQFDAGDPYGKDPRVNNDGGSKRFGTGRVDFNYRLSDSVKLLTFAYATDQDYSRFYTRPVSATTWSQREETYHRKVSGLGFSLNGRQRLGPAQTAWVAGAESYRESTDYLFFEGTLARARTAPAAYDRRYDFDSQSVFGEAEATFAPWLRPTFGVRWDRFSGGCSRSGAETGSDPCATLDATSRTTPKIGVRSTVARGLDLRASYAEGFALPPGAIKYAAGAAGLQPTVFRQREVGAAWTSRWAQADVAAYVLDSSNEVRTVSPGVYENFGATRRKGFEASLNLTPGGDASVGLVYSRTATRVIDNANAALVGNQVTGVPSYAATLSAAWRPERGFGAIAELRRLGDSAVDAANTVFYGAFTTLDLGAQYVGRTGGARWRAYARLDNATDRVYATNAFSTVGGVTLAPAPPRSLKVGVQVDL